MDTIELCEKIREEIFLALRQENTPRDMLVWLSGKLECVDPVLTTALKTHLERTRPPSAVDQLTAPGMSLRDWFAGQALACMTVAPDYSRGPCDAAIVARAFVIADAMLAARKEKP